jgi:hypothetical protein
LWWTRTKLVFTWIKKTYKTAVKDLKWKHSLPKGNELKDHDMAWHVGGIGHLHMALLLDCWDQESIIWMLESLYQYCFYGKNQLIYWSKCFAIHIPTNRFWNVTENLRWSWFMGHLLYRH